MQRHGYIGEFEIIDDHRSGKIVVELLGIVKLYTQDASINVESSHLVMMWHLENSKNGQITFFQQDNLDVLYWLQMLAYSLMKKLDKDM